MQLKIDVPVLGFVAPSGTGKTRLLTRLIPELRHRAVRCAVIKHSHHDFEIDVPGKDSHRLRMAGARQVLLASPYRTFWVEEGSGSAEPRLPKIEIHRTALDTPLLCRKDPDVIALATDAESSSLAGVQIPCLPLNSPAEIAEFVLTWLRA